MKKEKDTISSSFSSSNVILFLKTLSKEEIRELEKFINSPFHNNRAEVTRFFTELKKFYPGFSQKNFSKEEIFGRLYPKTKYRDDVIRRLSSNLLKLSEEFGAYVIFRKEHMDYEKNVLGFYLAKSAGSLYRKQLKKTEAFLEEQPLRDAKYFLNVNFLEESKRMFQVSADPSGKIINAQKQIESIWAFSVITLLRLYMVTIQNSMQFNRDFSIKNLDQLLNFVEQSDFMNSVAVEIWYHLVKFYTSNRDHKTFIKLKDSLTKNAHIFEPVEGFVIYVGLLGYCYDMSLIPGKNIYKEEFEIISHMLNNGLMVQDGVFNPEWFMYAFITSLRAGEVRFAEDLIKNHKDKIPEKERHNIINHAYAELSIKNKDFKSALKLLSVQKYNNVAEKLRANHMYIKIYYELGLSEEFFYNVDSFKHLIKNESSLNKEIKTIREKFIKYTVILFRLKLNEIDIPIDELKIDIMRSKILGNKWLLEKVNELELSLKK